MATSEPELRVAVIGAGLSGLITAHEALQAGMSPVLFDVRENLGGLFNSHTESSAPGQVAAYDDLHLTISNYLMAFGAAPPPGEERRRFWSRREYLEYLQNFARDSGLLDRIRFRTRVLHVQRDDGLYSITFEPIGGSPTIEQFDAVAVCTGTNARKFIPPVPGIETFQGVMRHAGDFIDATGDEAYVGRRVAVVGFGESGADTVRAVSEVSASTIVSLRSYPFVVQRLLHDEEKYLRGEAADAITSPAHHLLKRSIPLWLIMLIISWCQFAARFMLKLVGCGTSQKDFDSAALQPAGQGWHSGYRPHGTASNPEGDAFGVCQRHKLIDKDTKWSREAMELQQHWNSLSRFRTFATKNYTSATALLKNSTQINLAGIERIDGSTIYFKDGEAAYDVETILWNTGYTDDLSFLAAELKPENGARSLLKNAFKPGLATLAFVGWARPSFGGVPICSEMVARYWMLLLRSERMMPTRDETLRIIEADKHLYAQMFPLSGLSTLVDLFYFMDSLSMLIGCQPNLLRLILTGQFDLVWKYLYGQHVPSWYRLHGPGSDFETHAAVIRRLPVCLTPWNTVKHAAANLLYSTGAVGLGDRFMLMEWFNL